MERGLYKRIILLIRSGLSFAEKAALTLPVLILPMIVHVQLLAQNNSDTTANIISNNLYVEKIDTIITLRLNVSSEFEQFEIKGDNFYYDIRPNISLFSKISVNYRYISFGFGFTPRFIPGNNDNDLKGTTNTFSLSLNIAARHLLQDLQLLRVRGFYLFNTGDYDPGWNKDKDPYIQFPDLKVVALRGSTGYKVNENFSLKSISSQTEIQRKSCGSLFPYLIYNLYVIDDESKGQPSSQRSENFDATASIGYAYTFVIRSRYYASLGITSGIGLQYTNLLTRLPEGNYTTRYTDPLFRLQEKIAFGYNTRKLFAGLETSFAQSTHYQSNTSVQTKSLRTFFQVFIGYRFTAPWFIRHETDVVKNAVPSKMKKLIE